MAVTPEQTVAHVRAAMERRTRALESRADEARRIAASLARRLVEEWGAKRVILFGSLVREGFHERSDIDLAVEGLDAADLLDAAVALDPDAGPFEIDIVSLERQPEAFRERIEALGIVLP